MLQMASDFTIQDVSVHQSYPEPTKPPLGQFTSGNTEIIVLEASNWEEYHEMYWCVGYECQNGCIITVRVNVYDDNKVLKLSYQLTINLNCEGEDAASLEISVEYDALINGVMRIIKRSFVICSEAGSSHFFNNDYEMGYINVYYNNLRDIPTDRGEGWDTSVFTPAHYDFYPTELSIENFTALHIQGYRTGITIPQLLEVAKIAGANNNPVIRTIMHHDIHHQWFECFAIENNNNFMFAKMNVVLFYNICKYLRVSNDIIKIMHFMRFESDMEIMKEKIRSVVKNLPDGIFEIGERSGCWVRD